MEEAESNTLASLRSGAMSILEAIAVELPDVFAVDILPKVDLRDTLSLAQVSKRYRDAVWSVEGVRSLQAKIDLHGPIRDEVIWWFGQDAMACAIASNNLPAIRALLKSGREVEEEIKHDGKETWGTPLLFAAYVGHLGAVRVLIEAGADINKQAGADINKRATFHGHGTKLSALLMACVHDRPDVVMQLIKAGADVNDEIICCDSGLSALEAAVVRGYEACVALLISAGADIPESVIDYAKVYPDGTNILKMLKCARSW